jgi:hypothetical protein
LSADTGRRRMGMSRRSHSSCRQMIKGGRMKWMRNMQWSDFFITGLICWLCEAFFIRRCWKVRGILVRSIQDSYQCDQITDKSIYVLLPLSALALSVLVADIFWVGMPSVGQAGGLNLRIPSQAIGIQKVGKRIEPGQNVSAVCFLLEAH